MRGNGAGWILRAGLAATLAAGPAQSLAEGGPAVPDAPLLSLGAAAAPALPGAGSSATDPRAAVAGSGRRMPGVGIVGLGQGGGGMALDGIRIGSGIGLLERSGPDGWRIGGQVTIDIGRRGAALGLTFAF